MRMTDRSNPAFRNEVASQIMGLSQDLDAKDLLLQRIQVAKNQNQITHSAICLFLQACSHDSDCGKEGGNSQQEVGQTEQCSQGLCVTLQFSTEAAACGEVQSSQGVGHYTFLLQRKLRMHSY